jgi:hypothetical protein
MNAVEIEQAISALVEQPFDAQEFPFAFLQAFGNKDTTIKRARWTAAAERFYIFYYWVRGFRLLIR